MDSVVYDRFDLFRFMREMWAGLTQALVITRREIIDTLRDWRLVMPIVILVTVFPFLANFAAVRGLDFVNQYGAALIVERLFPFLMLVVGFFPSSFSLVIALETFVGEKERRSLEPLLSTPLTDVQIYIGKLLAATIPPVLGSYLGMGVYILLLGFSVSWWPPVELLVISFVLATSEALVMVTAAIIVSSQSTSVRAANLLASFIIVPMAFLLQGEASLLLFANYAALWWIALFLLVVNVLLIRLGLRLFDREHVLGRDIDTILKKMWLTFWHAFLPVGGIRGLYFREIPQLLRNFKLELLFTVGVVIVGALCVGTWASENFTLPAELLGFTDRLDVETIQNAAAQSGLLPSFSPWAIFVHNVRSLVGAALLGLFSMGVLALLILMLPIAIIVYITQQVALSGFDPWLFITAFVLPHGILELPAAMIATAQAMRMGDIILRPPESGGGVPGIIREFGHFVKLFLVLVLPLLLAAAWIEAEITPQVAVYFFSR
ncbi:MAG: stage II sporulation protein M [Anaerolineae bacterium]|nr:stage II sporulation protein M [Anaerolineae bacterium]